MAEQKAPKLDRNMGSPPAPFSDRSDRRGRTDREGRAVYDTAAPVPKKKPVKKRPLMHFKNDTERRKFGEALDREEKLMGEWLLAADFAAGAQKHVTGDIMAGPNTFLVRPLLRDKLNRQRKAAGLPEKESLWVGSELKKVAKGAAKKKLVKEVGKKLGKTGKKVLQTASVPASIAGKAYKTGKKAYKTAKKAKGLYDSIDWDSKLPTAREIKQGFDPMTMMLMKAAPNTLAGYVYRGTKDLARKALVPREHEDPLKFEDHMYMDPSMKVEPHKASKWKMPPKGRGYK